MRGWRAGLLLPLLLLAGCGSFSLFPDASEPRRVTALVGQPVEVFDLEGRLSVRSEDKTFSGGLAWHRAIASETLLLNSPLGQGVAEIRREGGGVMLTDSEGRQYRAESGEMLLHRVVGISLPVDGLVYWLSALPRPEGSHEALVDPEGKVLSLSQDGWRIDYDRYQSRAGRWLPGRIFARRGESLEFRLVVDEWIIP